MKKKIKIGICGNYPEGLDFLGGQPIKTILLTNQLKERFGQNNVIIANTEMNKVRLLFRCIRLAVKCENIIIIVAHNGVRVLIPLFAMLSKIMGCKTHYIIVGGWLGQLLEEKKHLLKWMARISYIYSQTKTLKDILSTKYRLSNVCVMNNFKTLEIVSPEDFRPQESEVFNVCCLSRIESQKGIRDAVEVVERINSGQDEISVKLDIYGPVMNEYEDEFFTMIRDTEDISYKGTIEPDQTVAAIKDYYLLLFPTRYYTEGIPGTVLDAYFAGIPVLSSKWESFDDVIEEGVTGVSYSFGDTDDFYRKFLALLRNPDICFGMKSNCVRKAREYLPDVAIQPLLDNMDQ